MNRERIIFLIENMSFPRDRRVRQEASVLASCGFNVSVVCPKAASDKATFEIFDDIRVYRYWQPWQGRTVFSYLLEYGWAMLLTFILILWIWMSDGLDVLHAANPPDLFFVIALPFMIFGKKFVYDQHDLCPELLDFKFRQSQMARVLRFFERWSYRLANRVIVTNESARDIAMARGGLPGDKIDIVRNGPDLDNFVSKLELRESRKPPNGYLALYVGAIAKQDGVELVIRAVHHIVHQKSRTDVKFAILGDGEELQRLRAMARALDVSRFIYFAGWVGDKELAQYLSSCDVCLAPDPPVPINQLSTFIKIMEYMSYGKVTVSLNLLESRRTAGSTAIYVEQCDAALYGDAILKILDDPERRNRLGRAAAERVRTSLHWGLSAKALVAAYNKMLDAPNGSSARL